MKFTDIMEASGLTKEQIAAKYGIPLPTLKSWIYDQRTPPEWVLTMFTYIFMLERSLDQYAEASEGLGSRICEGTEAGKEACEES